MPFGTEVDEGSSDNFLNHVVVASVDKAQIKAQAFQMLSVFCCGTMISTQQVCLHTF